MSPTLFLQKGWMEEGRCFHCGQIDADWEHCAWRCAASMTTWRGPVPEDVMQRRLGWAVTGNAAYDRRVIEHLANVRRRNWDALRGLRGLAPEQSQWRHHSISFHPVLSAFVVQGQRKLSLSRPQQGHHQLGRARLLPHREGRRERGGHSGLRWHAGPSLGSVCLIGCACFVCKHVSFSVQLLCAVL